MGGRQNKIKFLIGSLDLTNQTSTSSIALPNGGLFDLDVTDIVAEQYDSGFNGGLVGYALTQSNLPGINSSEATAFWGHPMLTIEYHYEGDPIPEPGTMLLMGSGLLGMIGYMRRKRMA